MTAVTLRDPGQIGLGRYFVDEYKNTANGVAFGQGLVSHLVPGQGWWQYAAFYDPTGQVVLVRIDPAGQQQTAALAMSIPDNDSHYSLALGVSRSDGRLHVCRGGHAEAMQYTMSAEGILDDPPSVWDSALFGPVAATLGSTVIGSMTYPTFVTEPDGYLLFLYRNGGSSNGRLRLAEWDGLGWTALGDVTASTGSWANNGHTSTSRGFYWVPPVYEGNRLHLVGTWRESAEGTKCSPSSPIANHHVVYVFSDDHGRTWHNRFGDPVAETGLSPVSVNGTGLLIDSSTGINYALQLMSMAYLDGRLVYLANYVRGNQTGGNNCVDDDLERINKAGEHARWRNGSGAWSSSSVVVGGANIFCEYPNDRAGRGHIALGPSGDLHVIYSGLRVYSATLAAGYSDWALTFDGANGPRRLNPFGEFQIDRSRANEGLISVLYSEIGSGGAAPVCVRTFELSS